MKNNHLDCDKNECVALSQYFLYHSGYPVISTCSTVSLGNCNRSKPTQSNMLIIYDIFSLIHCVYINIVSVFDTLTYSNGSSVARRHSV